MLRVILIFVVVIMGLAPFTVPLRIQKEPIYYPYCVNDKGEICSSYLVDWVYFLQEHLQWIIVGYILWAESSKFKIAVGAFFIVQILDLIDFTLTFNTEWGTGPMSMNVLGIIIFGGAIIVHQVWTHLYSH